MVGQIGPLVQVGRKKTALALHVLGGVAGGLAIGVVLGFLGVLLRAAIGDALDTVFLIVVPTRPDLRGARRPGRPAACARSRGCARRRATGRARWGTTRGSSRGASTSGSGVTTRIPYQTLLVVPLSAFLVGGPGHRRCDHDGLRSGSGARRRRGGHVGEGRLSGGVRCDLRTGADLKKLVGASALVIAALIVIS